MVTSRQTSSPPRRTRVGWDGWFDYFLQNIRACFGYGNVSNTTLSYVEWMRSVPSKYQIVVELHGGYSYRGAALQMVAGPEMPMEWLSRMPTNMTLDRSAVLPSQRRSYYGRHRNIRYIHGPYHFAVLLHSLSKKYVLSWIGSRVAVLPAVDAVAAPFQWSGGAQTVQSQLKQLEDNLVVRERNLAQFKADLVATKKSITRKKHQLESLKMSPKEKAEKATAMHRAVMAIPGVRSCSISSTTMAVSFHPILCRDVRPVVDQRGRYHMLLPPMTARFDAGLPDVSVEGPPTVGALHPHHGCFGDMQVALNNAFREGDAVPAVGALLFWLRNHGAGSYTSPPPSLIPNLIQYWASQASIRDHDGVYDRDGVLVPFTGHLWQARPLVFPELSGLILTAGASTSYAPYLHYGPEGERIGQSRLGAVAYRMLSNLGFLGTPSNLSSREVEQRVMRADNVRHALVRELNTWMMNHRMTSRVEHMDYHARRVAHHGREEEHTTGMTMWHHRALSQAAFTTESAAASRPQRSAMIPMAMRPDAHADFHDNNVEHSHGPSITGHLPGEATQHAVWIQAAQVTQEVPA